jgi:hypothetical protein
MCQQTATTQFFERMLTSNMKMPSISVNEVAVMVVLNKPSRYSLASHAYIKGVATR